MVLISLEMTNKISIKSVFQAFTAEIPMGLSWHLHKSDCMTNKDDTLDILLTLWD